MTTRRTGDGPGPPGSGGDARRRELLERYLRGALPVAATAAPIRRASREGPLPLSFAQQRLWFLDQLRPGGTEYVAPWIWRLTGPPDIAALRAAWTEVVRRHEVLRTRYQVIDGESRQLVDAPGQVGLPVADLSGLPAAERDRAVAELTERELSRPFDLGRDAPLRLRLLRLGPETHLLVFTVHHIAFDGWSVGVLARELGKLYAGFATGAEPALAAPPVQYADFAVWQHEWTTSEAMARQLGYWRDRLAGLTPLELATDRPRPPMLDTRGATFSFPVPGELAQELAALGRARRATPFMVLLAAFQVLLARYSGQTDIAVGTPIAGRTKPDVRDLLGFFVNTMVLRADLSGEQSFLELLDQVRSTALAAYANQELPFERLVTELSPERDLSRNPLFSHMFMLQNNETADFQGASLRAESLPVPSRSAKFDLTLQLTERSDGGLDGMVEYATALFDRETVERLAGHFVHLLTAIAAAPQLPLRRLEMVSAAERRRLLERWNDTARPVPASTVPELFERQARRTPDAPAVRSAGVELSYAELDARANQLACHLRVLGIGPGALVGVDLERGTDLVVAFLAVLKSGAAYLPIDPGYPSRRVGFLLADAGTRLVITQDALLPGLPGSAPPTVVLDRDRARIAARPAGGPGRSATPDDLAYLIYTSGSTGTPKGVMVDHRALANFLLAMADRPGLRAGDTLVGITTVSFDPSALELYLPLLVGARLVLADPDEARDPHRMADLVTGLVADDGRAVVQATPTTWRMLLDSGWTPPAGVTVLCGGERLPPELGRRLTAGGAAVWDLYGPTEATIWASTARLDAAGRVADWAAVANTTVHVLDQRLEPVPEGVIGELYLGGTNVAWGYHRRPALTARRFVADPHAARPGARLYRTGDLARRHRDGSVEILGREDHQVKIRGHRMEPGEIEAALLAHPLVRDAVVHPTATPSGEDQLTAYLVTAGDGVPTAGQLRAHLLRALPDYMIPASYLALAALPRTPNGKIDRAALPLPGDLTPASAEHVAPRTPRERAVADVWREVLDRQDIGVHDNFFEIGGHSLLATGVTIRLRDALGIDVPVRALFDHGTVAALAAALTGYPPLVRQSVIPVLTRRSRTGRPEPR